MKPQEAQKEFWGKALSQHKKHLHKRLDDDIYSATFETCI